MVEFDKPQETTFANPEHPGTLSPTNLLPWQQNISADTHEAIGKEINNSEKILGDNQGLNASDRAASSIINGMGPGLSRALSDRATKMFASNQASNRIALGQNNVMRQRREMARIGNQLNTVERLKIENAKAQLRFADQIADYNNDLEMAKYQVLSNIIGGAGSFYGGMLGGAAKPRKAAGPSNEGPRESNLQATWEGSNIA